MKIMIFFLLFVVTVWPNDIVAAETIQVFAKNYRVFAVCPQTHGPVWSDDGILYEDVLAEETTSTPPSDVSIDVFCPLLVHHLRLYTVLGSQRDVLVALDLRREGRLVWRISAESLGGGTFILPMKIGNMQEQKRENDNKNTDENEADWWDDTLSVGFKPTDSSAEPQKLYIDVATGIVLPQISVTHITSRPSKPVTSTEYRLRFRLP